MSGNKRNKLEEDLTDSSYDSVFDKLLGKNKSQMSDIAEQVNNMSYDNFTQGDTYKNLEKRYQDNGQKAMDDTIGKVAARTGGIASSYATQAGQQAYQDWMANLEDAARSLYDSERQEMLDRYQIAKDMYNTGYQEQRDNEADYKWLREQSLAEEKYDYAKEQDAKAEREAAYTALQNEIYEAAYNGTASWEKFQSRAEDLGMDKNAFLGIAKQARNDKHSNDEEANAIDPQSAISQIEAILANGERDENGNLLQAIPDALIKASGLDPVTLAAYEYAYANPKPVVEPLDLSGDEVVAQLQSGNINERTLATYEELYGEPYVNAIIRDGSYLAMSEDQVRDFVNSLNAMGRTEEGISLFDAYHGYDDKPLIDRNYTATDAGGKNGGGGINRDAVVADDKGNEYRLSELIGMLVSEGSFATRAEAKAWIEKQQSKWGVNTGK